MRNAVLLLLCFLLPAMLAAEPPPSRRSLAFTHVTLIDGAGAKPRRDQTVLIADGRIAAIGKSGTLRLPADARVVDATGRFLIPGLWDMHVHVGANSRFYLPLFIANGVTGVRIMSGSPEHHAWRREVEAGAAVGPRMVIASAVLDGPDTYFSEHVPVADAKAARAAVGRAKQEGAQFIKIHDLVPRAAYFALTEEARRQGLPVAGHIPAAITPEQAAEAGQATVEHLTRLDDLDLSDAGRTRVDALFARFRKHHTWHCPTLVMTRGYVSFDDPTITGDPRVKYVRPRTREGWNAMKNAGMSAEERVNRRQIYRKKLAIVSRMQRAGVGILAGTDLGNPYCFPGSSLADELALLVEAGLMPMEALQTATRNPARLLGREKDFGTIRKGMRADLVLLDSDPLSDIRNTKTVRAVVADGRLYDRAALDALLADAEAAAARAQ